MLEYYEAILELWDTILSGCPDSETRARIDGAASVMKTVDYFFGATLLWIILKQTDNLSNTLQHTKTSASEGQAIARKTDATLQVNVKVGFLILLHLMLYFII